MQVVIASHPDNNERSETKADPLEPIVIVDATTDQPILDIGDQSKTDECEGFLDLGFIQQAVVSTIPLNVVYPRFEGEISQEVPQDLCEQVNRKKFGGILNQRTKHDPIIRIPEIINKDKSVHAQEVKLEIQQLLNKVKKLRLEPSAAPSTNLSIRLEEVKLDQFRWITLEVLKEVDKFYNGSSDESKEEV
ncbi:unnamed protein product [Lactuca saligna]|uniref:Uncharacterized protein n=1 Tax=Lactuca saligna TaxID=75948 RepID=A0AA35V5C1_LACSI|nr:unnamed protein product [Lactuca saligna]